MEAGAARLLLETCKYRMCKSQNNTENLDGKDGLPQAACLNTENGSGTHCGACPRHQVQNTHCQDRDTKHGSSAHVHAVEYGHHSGNDDTECGSAAAVQMANQSDDAGYDADTDYVVSDEGHQLTDDDIKHTRIGHYTKV